MATLNIFVTSCSAYAAGSLAGDWFNVADYDGDDDAMLKAVGLKAGTEFFITDYDTDLHVDKSEHIDVADLKAFLDAMKEEYCDEDVANVILDECSGDVREAAKIIRDGDYSVLDCYDDSDRSLGEAVAELNCVLDGMPDTIQTYFDYDAYGRDFRLEVRGGFTESRNAFVYLFD